MATFHLPTDSPDLTASAVERIGKRITQYVWSDRPPNYCSLRPNVQRAIDTTLWTALAGIICLTGLACFLGSFGAWWGVIGCVVSLAQPVIARRLVRRGHFTPAMLVLVFWALLLVDGFLLTTGGIESSTAIWYAIIPGVAMVMMPPQLRLPAVFLVVVHQLLIVGTIRMGWYTDALRVDGAVTNAVFDFVMSSLFAGAFGFGVSVAHREMVERLRVAERNTRLATQFVVTGFLVIDRQGRLVVNSSAALENWFPGAVAGQPLGALLARAQPRFAEEFRVRFEALVEGTLPLALCLEQMPDTITLSGRPHRLSYQAIPTDGDSWDRLIITLDDQTNDLARAKAATERQTLAALIRSLQRDPRATQRWVQVGAQRVSALSAELEAESWDTTLAALRLQAEEIGIGVLVNAVDDARQAAAGGARAYAADLVDNVWEQLQMQYDELVEEDRFSGVRVAGHEYAQILRLIERRAPHVVLRNRALRWSPESTAAAIRTGEVSAASSDTRELEAAASANLNAAPSANLNAAASDAGDPPRDANCDAKGKAEKNTAAGADEGAA